jgi:hypothetical protein
MEERECQQCRAPYLARWTKQRGWSRFCSRDCSLKAWRAAGNAANAANGEGRGARGGRGPCCSISVRTCLWCGRLFTARYRNKKWCSRLCIHQYHYRAGHPQECRDCGATIEGPYVQRCDTCRAAARQAALSRHRAYNRQRKSGRVGETEPYTLAEIAARDRYRCGLCRKRVAMTKTVPHPKAPTIDHIVPWSISQDDTRANVQLAHFQCNCSKGARGVWQKALFG